LAAVFMQQFRGGEGFGRGWISKNSPEKATETVCMTRDGKGVAWVTGGGTGIGAAGAEALAADGWTVVISGRRKAPLDAVVEKIRKAGGEAEAIPLDVSVAADVEEVAEQILAKHGRIDLQVNSAGVNVQKRRWADMELEGWNQLVEINLNGVLYCMRAVLPAMRKQRDGSIINVSSWAGRHVSKMPGPAYTTTKHAVLALTHSFNMDECVNGLRACCLMPGEVATPETAARGAERGGAGENVAAGRSRPNHCLCRQHAVARVHERNSDQPDLEQGFYPDTVEQGLARCRPRRAKREPGPLTTGFGSYEERPPHCLVEKSRGMGRGSRSLLDGATRRNELARP
jgi:NAD(P)-dependent dehydrogenase (short-subunit alcohol dehydrogenase family)